MGNFSFLLKNDEYESFSKPCIEAENMIATSTVATAFMRVVLWSRLSIGYIVTIHI